MLLQTGGDAVVTSAVRPLNPVPGPLPALVSFEFGFTTEELLQPGSFADALTNSPENPDGQRIYVVTSDVNGSRWAPFVPGEHGPIEFQIEPGGLDGKTKFKFESVPLAQVLPLVSNTPHEGGRILGGVKLAAIAGQPMLQPPDVAFPVSVADMQLPPGVSPDQCAFGLASPLARRTRLVLGRGTAVDFLMGRGLARWEAEGYVNTLAIIRDHYKSDQVEAAVRGFGSMANLRRENRERLMAVKPEYAKTKTADADAAVNITSKQADGEVPAAQEFSVWLGATSAFEVTNVTMQVTGAVSVTRTFNHGGPFGLTFTVPSEATPGSTVTVAAQATDALGIPASAPPLALVVSAPPALPAPGILFLQPVLFVVQGPADKQFRRLLVNRGRIEWLAGRVHLQSGFQVGAWHNLAGGLLDAQSDFAFNNGSLLNFGTLQQSGSTGNPATALTTINASLTNHGTIQVLAGGLELRGASLSRGWIEVTADAAVFVRFDTHRWEANSSVAGDGEITVGSGATWELAGDWDLRGPFNVNGTVSCDDPRGTTLRRPRLAGTLDGAANGTGTGTFEWVSGELARGGGALALAAGATAEINGNQDKGLYRLFRNATTLRWNGGRLFAQSGGFPGQLHNLAGATFEIATDHQWSNGSLVNDGLVVKPGPARDPALFADSLGADVDFGELQVRFEGGSTMAGNFTMTNQPGGLFHFNHNLTLPGPITAGGELTVAGAATTVTILRVLTLLATGTLNNEGTLRAGQFVRESGNGGTLNGHPPVVIGLPGNNVAPPIRALRFGSSGLAKATADGRLEVLWGGDPAGRFTIEVSPDLTHWTAREAPVESAGRGRIRAWLPREGGALLIRVRDDAGGK